MRLTQDSEQVPEECEACRACGKPHVFGPYWKAHKRSLDHHLSVFHLQHWAVYSPVFPQELAFLQKKGLAVGLVIDGPKLRTNGGFARRQATYRDNPWVDRCAVLQAIRGFSAQVETFNTPKRQKFVPLETYKTLKNIEARFQDELKRIMQEATG